MRVIQQQWLIRCCGLKSRQELFYFLKEMSSSLWKALIDIHDQVKTALAERFRSLRILVGAPRRLPVEIDELRSVRSRLWSLIEIRCMLCVYAPEECREFGTQSTPEAGFSLYR